MDDTGWWKTTRVRRGRVGNIETARLCARRWQLMDLAWLRDEADGSKRHACQLVGERVAIEGELMRREVRLLGGVLPASHLARDILAEGGTLQPQGPRR